MSKYTKHDLYMYIHLLPNIISLALPIVVFLLSHHLPAASSLVLYASLAASAASAYLVSRPRPVYLVDFSCYKPKESCKCSHQAFMERTMSLGMFTEESVEFQRRVLVRSGVGEGTYFPEGVGGVPPVLSVLEARKEGEMVMFGAVDQLLLAAAGGSSAAPPVRPEDIDVLVVNCSLFSPTPSLAEMIVNRYKLREDVAVYNLSGMGCSAGIISIELASQLLKVHSNSYALIVSTENITLNGYYGNKRSMLITNCLFRMGGAAVLLSNRRSDRGRSKYVLSDLVRTHKGASDASHNCVRQEEDDRGKVGVSLSKDLMTVAGEALKANITTLGPRVLPVSEQLRFLAAAVKRRLPSGRKGGKPCVPDFKRAFEHFCIHAGGRGILDELERSLALSGWHMEPSRMTLYRYGNTSSSSLWYELAYAEAKGRVGRRDRVWQIAFGSGFKCNSVVWRALRDVEHCRERNPWMDVIDEFPVDVPKEETIAM